MRERRAVFRLFTTSGATGCCWLCCCLSGVTLARGVGLRWRHFLLGRRSHRPDLHNPIDLCQGALPLGHVFVEASTTRGLRHDEFWRKAVPDSCVPEKWYSFPLLIPQPDWDKYQFFSGLSHIWFLGLQGLIPLRDQSREMENTEP
jgi:hypothetical protein